MQTSNGKSEDLLIFVLILQIVTSIIIILNVPFARQVIGFFYFTFIPGIILLRILKLDELDMLEKILFSVGLSIAFLMFIGLLINELFPLMGVSKPLSPEVLMITLNSIIALLCFLSYNRNEGFRFSTIRNVKVSPLIILLFCLPVLSVAGAISVNVVGNNLILLLMIITISALVILISLSERFAPSRFYSLALLMMAIALLFHVSLISNYVNGHDIQAESYLFKLTLGNSYWNSTIVWNNPEYSRFNGMLSITILPSIYSSILNLDPVWVLKIIYPLIFSLVPLCLYKFYYMLGWEKTIAFISAFFFMAHETYYTEMLGLGKQMIAELFFILLFFVLLNEKMKPLSKSLCFIIFGFALVVSHYSIAYLFMFIIFFTWVFSLFTKAKIKGVTVSVVTLFFIMLFSWYIYVSRSGPFSALLSVGENVLRGFSDFFDPELRPGVLRGLGLEQAPSFGHLIGRMFAYITEFFIIVGFMSLIAKRKKTILSKEYIIISSLNMALLMMTIALPYFARSFNISRFYHMQLFFLAPLFIAGGITLFRFIWDKRFIFRSKLPSDKFSKFGFALKCEPKVLSLILVVLIPFFLYQTELVYEVTGDDSWSIPLSKYRMGVIHYSLLVLIHEKDVFGANWLSKNTDPQHEPLYADIRSKYFILPSYAMIERGIINDLSNTTLDMKPGGIIYLGQLNTIDGVMWGREGWWNTTEISSSLNNMNKIYSNGGSEIYKEPSK